MQRRDPIYINGIKHWQCPTCGQILKESSFYSTKKTWNGITSQCRVCHVRCTIKTRDRENRNKLNRLYMRRNRINNYEKVREREKTQAKKRKRDVKFYSRQMLNNAVKLGIIKKPKICEICHQEKKLTAHHDDYLKPLDVKWWCYECHGNK